MVIHTNLNLPNQVETAGWLQEGFRRHGIDAEVTGDRYKSSTIHVVQGPWYCYDHWLGEPNVLWLDRCFYGHPRFDVSLGWLRPDGSRDFKNHGMAVPRASLPVLKKQKPTRRCAVVFADYGEDCKEKVKQARREYDSVFFRPHPADNKNDTPVMTLKGDLEAVWEIADVAIGHSSTVLVEAMINGLYVESSDPLHVCQGVTDREQWLTNLSWAQWDHEALKRGEFWEHLSEGID